MSKVEEICLRLSRWRRRAGVRKLSGDCEAHFSPLSRVLQSPNSLNAEEVKGREEGVGRSVRRLQTIVLRLAHLHEKLVLSLWNRSVILLLVPILVVPIILLVVLINLPPVISAVISALLWFGFSCTFELRVRR